LQVLEKSVHISTHLSFISYEELGEAGQGKVHTVVDYHWRKDIQPGTSPLSSAPSLGIGSS